MSSGDGVYEETTSPQLAKDETDESLLVLNQLDSCIIGTPTKVRKTESRPTDESHLF